MPPLIFTMRSLAVYNASFATPVEQSFDTPPKPWNQGGRTAPGADASGRGTAICPIQGAISDSSAGPRNLNGFR